MRPRANLLRENDVVSSNLALLSASDDIPSDVVTEEDDYLQELKDSRQVCALKRRLFEISARTNRGVDSRSRDDAYEIISKLESLSPQLYTDEPSSHSLEGEWELVYTDTQLFGGSPFFLTLREMFGVDSVQAERVFQLHRDATSTGEIGRVVQRIDRHTLTSEVDLRVGIIPGQPFSLKGTVVSVAAVRPLLLEDGFPRRAIQLKLKETYVRDSGVIGGSFLGAALGMGTTGPKFGLASDGGTWPSIPVGPLLAGMRRLQNGEFKFGEESSSSGTGSFPVELITYYLDSTLRISRSADGKVFVYSRC